MTIFTSRVGALPALLITACMALSAAHAVADERKDALREKAAAMSPQEKAALRDKARERWATMSPQEKAQAREQIRQRWDSMTPQEQAEARERLAERHPRAAERRRQTPPGAPASAPAN